MTTYTLFAAMLLGAPGLKERNKPDPLLTGEWIAERVEQKGKGLKLDVTMTFDDHTMVMRIGGMEHRIPLKFDTSAKIKEITLNNPPPRGPLHGIYKIDGDILTICTSEKPDGPRPTEFSSSVPDTTLFVLRRAAKK